MISLKKDDFDESIEDIMESVSKLLDKTGEGYVVDNLQKDEKNKKD